MRVGVPREVKNREYRVALTPAGVTELVRAGHEVLVERGAGEGSSIPDADFQASGARIVADADDVWADADLLLKVKEPIAEEYDRLRRGQTLFTYLHLAASKECTDALIASGTTAIAYETVQTADGALPLLAPMSEVAGRMAPQVGAHTGDAAHEDAAAAALAHQVVRAGLRGDSSGDLAHRGEQREGAVGGGDGLVGDGGGPRRQQRVGAVLGGGEVQVGEQHLILAQS